MGNDQKKLISQSSYHPDIVIVKEKTDGINEKEFNKLQYVPLFYPILKSSIDLKDEQLLQLSTESIFKFGEFLKNNINTCAYNVTKDQDAINIEINHLNLVIDILMQNFTEKQKRYAKYCEQFKCVQEMSHNLKKIQRSVNEILPMLNELNSLLPENECLEDFSFNNKN